MSSPGSLLRLSRQLRGLTQKEAASKMKVAQAVLSRLENDLIDIDGAIIERAAAVYNLPTNFFSITDTVYGPPVSVHTMLRGKSDVSAREIDMITAELNIRLFHLRRFFENVDFRPAHDLPRLDVEMHSSVDDIAALVRAHWRLPEGPIKNLTSLVERAGVVIGLSDFYGSPVSGVTFNAPGNPPIVLLNMQHPSDRLRFTLAHELGHLIMHRFPTSEMENEANRFASCFLLPPKEMERAFRGRKIDLPLLAALKKEWRVSIQSLLMSASNIGVVSPNQERYLWQQISSRGWRTREPAELDFEFDKPSVLPSIVQAHLGELKFSLPDLVKMSHVYEGEFLKLYGDLKDDVPKRPHLRIIS